MSQIKYPEYVCIICNTKSDSSEENILRFGEWHTLGDISVHNFCLYFTYNLKQRANNPLIDTENYDGIDGENIHGFLLEDIRKTLKTQKRNKCKYCKKSGAATWCIYKKCRAAFHFDCGQQNDVQYEFYGQFNAFCPKHYDKIEEEKINENISYFCSICGDSLEEYHILNWIPSCCKTDWYHRDCIRRAAYYQGYDMKCLSCGSKKGLADENSEDINNIVSMPRKEYIQFLQHRGIFIPNRMASWELEPNAYVELLPTALPLDCNAKECLCENGKGFSEETGIWKMFKCITCGGGAIHIGCTNSQVDNYMCTDCYIDSQPPDFYETLTQSLATAEPIPQSQSPEPIRNNTIRYDRKEVAPYETKWNAPTPDGASSENESDSFHFEFEDENEAEEVDPTEPLTRAKYRETNARYAVADQCDAYVECTDGVPEEKLCSDGLLFNDKAGVFTFPCQYPIDVNCTSRARTQPAQATEECPHQFGYFPLGDSANCGEFLNCADGRGYKLDCPLGLAFNRLTYQCDWPDLVPDCDAEAYLRFTCPPQTRVEGFGAGVTKYYRSTDDCQRYFLCNNGRPRLHVCGVGAAFTEELNRCEAAENVTGCEHLAVTEEPERQPIYLKTLKVKN